MVEHRGVGLGQRGDGRLGVGLGVGSSGVGWLVVWYGRVHASVTHKFP